MSTLGGPDPARAGLRDVTICARSTWLRLSFIAADGAGVRDVARHDGRPAVLPHPEMFPSEPGIASPECSRAAVTLSTNFR
jgi:hypothetical protein